MHTCAGKLDASILILNIVYLKKTGTAIVKIEHQGIDTILLGSQTPPPLLYTPDLI